MRSGDPVTTDPKGEVRPAVSTAYNAAHNTPALVAVIVLPWRSRLPKADEVKG
jgi:hypothetical protein